MQEIRERFFAELACAASPKEVEEVRIRYLGRKGTITTLMKNTDFSRLTPDEKRDFGKRLNELKDFAQTEITRAGEKAKSQEAPIYHGRAASLPQIRGSGTGTFVFGDVTLPGSEHQLGSLHPITLVQMELEDIFQGMGFMVLTGFEVEKEHYNFDALNIPSDHPARDMQDTYWLTNGMLLRTHTSANQVRALERFGAPLRAIFPGRCFRYEATDAKDARPAKGAAGSN